MKPNGTLNLPTETFSRQICIYKNVTRFVFWCPWYSQKRRIEKVWKVWPSSFRSTWKSNSSKMPWKIAILLARTYIKWAKSVIIVYWCHPFSYKYCYFCHGIFSPNLIQQRFVVPEQLNHQDTNATLNVLQACLSSLNGRHQFANATLSFSWKTSSMIALPN